MVADDTLIPIMMYNTTIPDTNTRYADWRIQFAGNRIVLAYTTLSQYADHITPENWYRAISRPDVKVGWSNPLIDALVYRGLTVIQLAEKHYANISLFDDVINANYDPSFTRIYRGGTAIISVPELLNPTGNIALRASSV